MNPSFQREKTESIICFYPAVTHLGSKKIREAHSSSVTVTTNSVVSYFLNEKKTKYLFDPAVSSPA